MANDKIVDFHSEIESVNKKKTKKNEIKEPKKIDKNTKKKYKVNYVKIKKYFNIDTDKWNKLKDDEKKKYTDEYNKKHNIKTHFISMRVDDNDYIIINKLLKDYGMKKSEILYFFIHSITKKEREELIKEIKKQGVNINQIARHCNEEKDKPELRELQKLNENMEKLLNAF